MAESSIIIEYLEEHAKGGTQLIPSDPELAEDKRDALGVEAAQKRLDKTYGMLDDELAKRTWVLGDAFTIADISAAAALGIANMVRPFGAHKNLMAYFGRLTERPSVQRAFKQVQELMARG